METTHVYVEADLATKEKALAKVAASETRDSREAGVEGSCGGRMRILSDSSGSSVRRMKLDDGDDREERYRDT